MKHQNNPLWWMLLVTLVGVLLFCTLNNAPAQDRATDSRKALAATVSLEMQDRNDTILGQGSGFFVRHK